MGRAASLAHPGGNVTGSTFFYPELMAKRLDFLKQAAPSLASVGVLMVRNPGNRDILDKMAVTAKALNIKLHPVELPEASDFESAFSAWADLKVTGVVLADHVQLQTTNIKGIAASIATYRLPAIGPLRLTDNGGVVGYGVNFFDLFRRAAVFVDKILKGTKPADIPIEQVTKFKLVLNLKTAIALGLAMPTSLLLSADEVIE